MSVIMETSRPDIMIRPQVPMDAEPQSDAMNGDDSELPPPEQDSSISTLKQDNNPPNKSSDIPFDPKMYLDSLLSRKQTEKAVADGDVEMASVEEVNEKEIAPESVMSANEIETSVLRLQTELLKEEMKLALMKRMFQLQNQPPKPEKREEPVTADKKGQQIRQTAPVLAQHQNGLKNARGQHESVIGKGDKQQTKDSKGLLRSGPANYNNQRTANPTVSELTKSLSQKNQQQQNPKYSGNQGYNNAIAGRQQQQSTPQLPPSSKPHPVDVLEQQLSSEKAMLKRQMEKYILQLSPPRPPLPDINFIPSIMCPDFIALLGMELAANYAIKSKNLIDVAAYAEPYQCIKCGEDVCPLWKTDEDKEVIVCETCFHAARSTLSRLTHIENLKKAFSEVLEKEKELDKQHSVQLEKARAAHPNRPPAQKSVAVSSAPFPGPLNVRNQIAAVVNNHHQSTHHASVRPLAKAPLLPQQSAPVVLRSVLPPAPLGRTSGKPPITSPYAQLSAPMPFAPTSSSARSGQSASYRQHQQHQTADAQRQYLLDMISRAPKQSNPSTNGPWRKSST